MMRANSMDKAIQWEEMLQKYTETRYHPRPNCSGVTIKDGSSVGVGSDGVAHHMDFWDKSIIGVATKPIAPGEYLKLSPDGNVRLKEIHNIEEDAREEEEDICDEAKRITTHERQDEYGEPTGDFRRIAKMWSALFHREFKPHEVGMAMMCLKLSRMSWDPTKYDNALDAIGYGRCTWLCIKDEMDNGELYDGR